jgi:hypothetical protein
VVFGKDDVNLVTPHHESLVGYVRQGNGSRILARVPIVTFEQQDRTKAFVSKSSNTTEGARLPRFLYSASLLEPRKGEFQ